MNILDSRGSDVVRLPDGNIVSALHLTGNIFNLPGVHQFRIIQEAINHIVIKIVKTEGYSKESAQKAIHTINSLLPGIHAELEIVPEIEREASGKFRQFQSKVEL